VTAAHEDRTDMTQRIEDVRRRAQRIMQDANVLLEGHFDFGNGYHGRTYLNPHMLFCRPSTIWQLAQDLLDVLPYDVTTQVQAVVGPSTGGALLAHTLAGLLDGRRSLEHQPCVFAPIDPDKDEGLRLRSTYRAVLAGKKVLLADDVRNTGKTFSHCADLVQKAGGEVIATVQLYDRMASVVSLPVPNFALLEYSARDIYTSTTCPQCAAGVPLTRF
jgi:orotate phosphoribosyltransferase